MDDKDSESESKNESKDKFSIPSDLLKPLLECPVCLEIIRTVPINNCSNGHICCNTCLSKLKEDVCPTCKSKSGWTRNLIAAKLVDKIFHNCKYEQNGCKIQVTLKEIVLHEYSCKYRLVSCPRYSCRKEVPLAKLIEHMYNNDKCVTTKRFYNRLPSTGSCFGWRVKHLEYLGRDFFLVAHEDRNKICSFYVTLAGTKEEALEFRATVNISVEGDKSFDLSCKGPVGSIDDIPEPNNCDEKPYVFQFLLEKILKKTSGSECRTFKAEFKVELII